MKKMKKFLALISALSIVFTTFVPVMTVSATEETIVKTETLLDLQFDSADDASSILGLKAGSSWVRYASSQLAYIQDGSDYILRFPLSEAIDFTSDYKYEIELRAKIPYDNYRLMALSNGDTGTTGLYSAMASGMLALCRYSYPVANESDLSVDEKSGIGSASSSEWRTIKLTYENENITLDVTDEKASGNVTSTTTVPLSNVTGTTNFKHRPGTTYDHILLGHLSRNKELTLDYIKVTKSYSYDPYAPVELADFEFDGNDVTFSGLRDNYVWVRPASSQLAVNYSPWEEPILLPLTEAIDVTSKDTYKIEMRAKVPAGNMRFFGLKDDDTGSGVVYSTMINNFMLGYFGAWDSAQTESSKKIGPKGTQLTSVTASSNEWATYNYTIENGTVTLKMTVEDSTGTQKSTITENIATLTAAAQGSGNHVEGRIYEKIMLGNLTSGQEMTVDYVKAQRIPFNSESGDSDDSDDSGDSSDPNTIADFEFDGNDDASKIVIGSNSAGFDWVRYVSSQLAMLTNPYEQPVYLTFDEGIDLSSDNIYEIEMRLKAPIDNFYCASLVDSIDSSALMYKVIYNNLQLISTADGISPTSKKVQLAQTSQPIGSATSSEWKTLKYTFSKDSYELEATVERESGNVTSVTSGTIASITAATAAGGKHVAGKVYNHLALANTYSSSEMTVDYVKVTKKEADPENPWTPREYNDPDNTVVEPEEPDEPEEPSESIIGSIADFKFDGNDDASKIIIGANSASYDWVRHASSQLAMKTNPCEEPVYLKLDDKIDLTSDYIYEIEMRLVSPYDNYRFISLTNGTDNGLMYATMYNNFLLASTADGLNSTSKKIQLAQMTDPISSASSTEWRTLKYTLTKDYYQLESTVERATGNVSSVVSGPLSSITGTAAGGGKHVSGKVYDHIALANTYSTAEMTVDYVKVNVKEADPENPFIPSEFNDPDDKTVRTSIVEPGKVRFIGRGEVTQNGEKTLNWSGAGFEFKFIGTKAEVFVSDAAGTSYFNVWVDDEAPSRIALNAGWNTLTQNLDATKEHIIKVRRSSSAQHGTLKVQTIRTDGEISATEAPDKLIEFIGDSYTTGYGNLGGTTESATTTDARQSYAGYVAEKFGAEESLIAYAGRGIVKGYSPDSTYEMPVQFGLEEIYMDWGGAGRNMSSGETHDFTDYQPQYVVLWLGTNDYANNVPATTFAEKYEEFLGDIRQAYPDAIVLCMTRASTGYPTEVATAVSNMGGEEAGFYYEAINNFAASSIGHPSVAEATEIGIEVYDRLKKINNELKIWDVEDDEPVIPDEPEEPTDPNVTVIADFEFDGNDEGIIKGLADGYVWIRYVNSELAIHNNPYEIPVELVLDEAIDLSSEYTYEIEMRAKAPGSNMRYLALRDAQVADGLVYKTMINNFMLAYFGGWSDSTNTEAYTKINPKGTNVSTISASNSEWRIHKYIINKETVTLELSVEDASGVVQTETITENLSTLTTSGGDGGHVAGRKYETIAMGNLIGGTEYTVDYVKVKKYIPQRNIKVDNVVKGEEEISAVSQLATKDEVTVSVEYSNTLGIDTSYTVVAAYYGANDKLMSVQIVKDTETITKDVTFETKSYDMTIGDMTDVEKVKFFVWNSINGMIPYGEALSI